MGETGSDTVHQIGNERGDELGDEREMKHGGQTGDPQKRIPIRMPGHTGAYTPGVVRIVSFEEVLPRKGKCKSRSGQGIRAKRTGDRRCIKPTD